MNNCDLKHLGVLFAVMLIESWLGKTDKLKSGSIIELSARIILSILKTK